jgi:prepilin-type N-terminal cleavage/methylation domain-containing protein
MKNSKTLGFTLIEIAIALVILALFAGGVMVALRVQTQRAHIVQTRDTLEEAREALYNFAMTQGYLPCPAVDAQGLAGTCPGNTDGATSATSAGMLPWKDLGLAGTDAWSQPIRYAVSNGLLAPAIPTLAAGTNSALVVMDNSNRLNSVGSIAFALWSPGEDRDEATSIPLTSNQVQTGTGDDMVVWGSRYVLMGRLILGGRNLPLR